MVLSRLAGIVTAVMASAASVGLLVPHVYRDNALVRAAWFANDYAFYAFGAAFNALYLVYVGILVGSTLSLIAGLTSAPVMAIASRVRVPPGHRAVGLLIASIAGVLGVFWIAQALRSVVSGDVPAMVATVGRPTNVTGGPSWISGWSSPSGCGAGCGCGPVVRGGMSSR